MLHADALLVAEGHQTQGSTRQHMRRRTDLPVGGLDVHIEEPLGEAEQAVQHVGQRKVWPQLLVRDGVLVLPAACAELWCDWAVVSKW